MILNIVLKSREEIKLRINEECTNLYSKKLEAFNIIANKDIANSEKYKYTLISNTEEQEQYLGEIYTYVPLLMKTLWENPKTVANLIIKANKTDLKKNIAPFLANNFYENILSSNFIEDQLLYVIGLVLKNEIDEKIKTKADISKFLEDTACGIFLEQLKLKQDVQIYFKTLIYNVVTKLEEKCSSYKINFNIKNIEEVFNQTKKEIENEYNKSGKNQKVVSSDFFKKRYEYSSSKSGGQEEQNDDKEIFNIKYIPSLTKDEYKKLMDQHGKNKIMNDFFLSQWLLCKDNPNIYSNENLLSKIFDSILSKEILASYQVDFLLVIKIIDEFLKDILKYLYLIPYSVKCICKMIYIMIKKKLPGLSMAEYNSFIAKFFFDKLFSNFFEDPGTWGLINDFIISGVTRHNLKIICYLIKRLFSSKFFINGDAEGDYTPFNWFFIDKIPTIYQFCGNLIQVKIPSFMEKFINNELSENFEYDYFQENKEEGIFHRSICFSFQDLIVILKNMKILRDILLVDDKNINLKKILEKLLNKTSMQEIERIKNNIEYEKIKVYDPIKKQEIKEIKGKQILKYILISDILTNKNYTKLFNINKENCFALLEKKSSKTLQDNKKINAIKVKNFIYKLLNNYRTLIQTDFIEGTTKNTVNILKELKKYMKISNFIIDGSIPSQWYVDSLLEYLKKIPTDLMTNDYSNLYKEITSGLNVSIKELDFEALSLILSTVKFCKRRTIYYQNMESSLIELELNEKVQNIIDKEPISVNLEFIYNSKVRELKIEKSNKNNSRLESFVIMDNDDFQDNMKKIFYCKTIKAFTDRFPNIIKYQQIIGKSENNFFDIEKELNITNQLNNYFNIIKDFLLNKNEATYNLIDSEEFKNISNKIYDFVMEKLYDKIIPKEPDPIDNLIYYQCQVLDWTEPKHFISSKTNYVFDSFLPDAIQYFEEIEKQKSPRKKFIYVKKIFESIYNMVKFSGGGGIGADDSLEILNYALIKSKPTHIFTNCKFLDLFLGTKKYQEEELYLTQLTAACEYVQNITAEKLQCINEEQFLKKCSTFAKD